jgi:hypothetical protein
MNDDKFVLPGPNNSVYLLTFRGACKNCDGSDEIIIERFANKRAVRDYLCWAPDEYPETIKLEKWPESHGVCIITGKLQHEFVEALKGQLIGMKPADFVDKPNGVIDENAADAILEEMYDDSTTRPKLAPAPAPT